MVYRDERDALRSRVDNLEQQIEEARREASRDVDRQAKVAELEARMREARSLIETLGREVEGLREPKSTQASGVQGKHAILVVAASLIISTSAFFVYLRSRSKPPSVYVAASTPVAVTQEPPPPAPVPVSVTPPDPPAPVVETPKSRAVTAVWAGRGTRSSGSVGLAPGSPCTVTAELDSTGPEIHENGLVVACGGKRLYSSQDALSGMSMMRSGAREELGPDEGTTLYAIAYEDTGPRSGARSQLSILNAKGEVWSDSAPSFRVAFTLPNNSAPVTGSPLLDASRKGFRKGYSVEQASPGSPVKPGTRCKVRATPLGNEKECLVHLSCGGKVLFGGNTQCTVGDEGITDALDPDPTSKDRDPAIHFNQRV